MKVLVTDGENKNALAAVRSLSAHGATVIVGSARRANRSSFSRYATARVHYPSPEDEMSFLASVEGLIDFHEIDVVLPIGDAANRVCSQYLYRLGQRCAIPVAPWPAMQIASSKALTMPFAERVGIPIPRSYASKEEVDSFPVVVKRSKGAGAVRYVNDEDELQSVDVTDSVIQEFIPGDGFGFFALFDRGTERATFMHRRLREYPITGGASTAAESVYDETLEQQGLELLRALDWHGVAMVEFKRDRRDGLFKLMEINPKFWGSLDLSIVAGVDFPWLATLLALRQLDGSATPYECGVKFRWVFDDVMHVVAKPSSFKAFVRDFHDPNVHHDVYASDPGPALFDALKTLVLMLRRALRGTLKRPHGEIKYSRI